MSFVILKKKWMFFYFVVLIFSSSFFPSPSFPSFLLFFPLFFATLLFVYKNEFILIMRIRISFLFFFFWIQFLPAAGGDSREIIVETCGFGKKIRSEKIRRFLFFFSFFFGGKYRFFSRRRRLEGDYRRNVCITCFSVRKKSDDFSILFVFRILEAYQG